MRLPPVGRDHAERAAGTGHKGCRLDRTQVGAAVGLEVTGSVHEFAGLNITDQDAPARSQRLAARARGPCVDTLPERRSVRVKAPPGHELQGSCLWIEDLHARGLRAHDSHHCLEDLFVESLRALFRDQLGADPLKLASTSKFKSEL